MPGASWLGSDLLWTAFLACLVLVAIHSYLGLHVLERGVIFVDLALAQIAALGATIALLVGDFPMGSPEAWWLSLGFTLVGAAIFALTRMRESRIPQEAIIGTVYAVASAAAIVVVAEADDPHGAEHIQELLAGNILYVTPGTILVTALIYAGVGLFHFLFRRPFLEISADPAGARARGRNLLLWDFLFYGTFGFVITSSVQIAGVLLVFTFLIVPAVFAMLFARRLFPRLLLAWGLGTAVSFAGLAFSFDRPSGPVIVTLFGVVLLVAGVLRFLFTAEKRGRAALQVAVGAGALAAMVAAAALLRPSEMRPHVHAVPGHGQVDHGADGESDRGPAAGEAELDRVEDVAELLLELAVAETEARRLELATSLLRRGHERGAMVLRELARSEDPRIREQALSRLRENDKER